MPDGMRTNIARHLRTLTPNKRPTATSLLEGEIALELGGPYRIWAGVPSSVDASGMVLIADSSTTFPDAPIDSQLYGRRGSDRSWQPALPIAGGTLTGTLTLVGDPQAPLQAATRAYVDAHTGGIGEAPQTGLVYGRINEAWTQVLPIFGGTLVGPLTLWNDGFNPLHAVSLRQMQAAIAAANIVGVSKFNGRQGDVVLLNQDVVDVLPSSVGIPLMDGTATAGAGLSWSRGDHVHPTDTSRAPVAYPIFTGTVTLNVNAVQPLEAVPLQQLNIALGSFLPLSGGVLSGGLGFGSSIIVSGDPTDTSRHITLHSSGYGFGITANRLNYNAPANATHWFLNGGTGIVRINVFGLTMGTGAFLQLDHDPTSPMEAVNLRYLQGQIETVTGSYVPLVGGTMSGALTLWDDPSYPSLPLHAVTKRYVDTGGAGGPYLALAGGHMTGPLFLVSDPSADLHAVTLQYLNWSTGHYLMLLGGTMQGPIILSGPPTTGLNPATKDYVDTNFVPIAGGGYVQKAGDTMTGALTIASATDAKLHIIGTGGDWPGVTWDTNQPNSAAGYFESRRYGLPRWAVEFGGSGGETGGNVGTNFLINRFDDTGQPIYPSPLQIIRQTGVINIGTPLMLAGPPTTTNQAATMGYVDSKSGSYLPIAGGVMHGGISWADIYGIAPTDAANHLILHSGFGIGITANRFNFITGPADSFVFINSFDTLTINSSGLSMATGKDITLARAPGNASHAANKGYVDLMLPLTGGAMSGGLSFLDSNYNTVAGRPDLHNHIQLFSGYGFSITSNSLNIVTAGLTWFSNSVTGLDWAYFNDTGLNFVGLRTVTVGRQPTADMEVATKKYVDTGAGAFLPLAGGTMLGPLKIQNATNFQMLDSSGTAGFRQIIGGDNHFVTLGTAASGADRVISAIWMRNDTAPVEYFVGLNMVAGASLILDHNPTTDYEAATKRYADNVVIGAGGPFLPITAGPSQALTGALYLPHATPTIDEMATPKFYVDLADQNLQSQISAVVSGNLVFYGQLDVASDVVHYKYTISLPDSPMPLPTAVPKGGYVIVTVGGIPPTGTGTNIPPLPLGTPQYVRGDWFISDGEIWIFLPTGLVYFTADAVTVSPPIEGTTNVQATLAWLNTNKLNIAGGTMTGSLILYGPPTSDLMAATRLYVDTKFNSGVVSFNNRTGPVSLLSADISAVFGLLTTGGAMVGDLQVIANPTTSLSAVPRSYVDAVSSSLGNYLPLAGGVMQGGIIFPNTSVAVSNTDTSKYLTLYTGFGFGISGSRLNYTVDTNSSHVFMWAGIDRLSIGSSGTTILSGSLLLAHDPPTTGTEAATKNYVDGRTPLSVDAPNNTYSYGRHAAAWAMVPSHTSIGGGAFDLNSIPADYIGTHQITNQSGAANWPADIWVQCAFVLSGFNSNSGWRNQILMGPAPNLSDAAIWYRNQYNGIWSSWWRIITSNGGTFTNTVAYDPPLGTMPIRIYGNQPNLTPGWGGALAFNYSAGGAELDFFNMYAATTSFAWYQVTGTNAATRLAWMMPNGDFSTTGSIHTEYVWLNQTPTASNHAATLGQVNAVTTSLGNYLALSGGTLTGPVTFNQSTTFTGQANHNNLVVFNQQASFNSIIAINSNMGGANLSGVGVGIIGWNWSNGGAEVDFVNGYTGFANPISFGWYQFDGNTSTSWRTIATLGRSGNLTLYGVGTAYNGLTGGGNLFGFTWSTSNLPEVWVDGISHGLLAQTSWVGSNYLALTGGILSGDLTISSARVLNLQAVLTTTGTIHSDNNWGLLIQGLAGAAADVGVVARNGYGLRVQSDGTVSINFGASVDPSGMLWLKADPTAGNGLQAATKQYVDTKVGGGVTSFNTRTGPVVLLYSDVTGVLPPSATAPIMDGTATAGIANTFTRGDHVHPTDTSRVNKAGDTMNGSLIVQGNIWAGTGTANAATVAVQSAATTAPGFRWYGATQLHWNLAMDQYPESTDNSNQGGNLGLYRYGDNGSFLGTLLSFTRADGTATFGNAVILGQDPSTDMGAVTRRYVDNKAGLYLPLAGGTMNSGANVIFPSVTNTGIGFGNISTGMRAGNADAATFNGANLEIVSWNGIGFGTSCGPVSPFVPVGLYSVVMDTRWGDLQVHGRLIVSNSPIGYAGSFLQGLKIYRPTASDQTIELNNNCVFPSLASATPAAGGSGYAVNDRLYDAGGNFYTVTGISGGAVTSIQIDSCRIWYGVAPANPLALTSCQGFSGTGCTINLTWTMPTRMVLQHLNGNVTLYGTQGVTINGGTGTTVYQPATFVNHTQFQQGIDFNSYVSSNPQDTSGGITLWGSAGASYGFVVTSNTLNYNSFGPSSMHDFYVSGSLLFRIQNAIAVTSYLPLVANSTLTVASLSQFNGPARINAYTASWGAFNFGSQLLIQGGNNNGLGICDSGNTQWAGIFNSGGSLIFAKMPVPTDSTTPPVQWLSLATSGALFSEKVTVNTSGSDPMEIVAPSGQQARYRSVQTGVRTWSFGTRATDGFYAIGDETAAAYRLTIDTVGNVYNFGPLYNYGLAKFSNANDAVNIDGANGTWRTLTFTTSGVARWNIQASNAGESGTSAGSDFFITRWNNSGGFIDQPFAIARSTGQVTIQPVNLNDGLSLVASNGSYARYLSTVAGTRAWAAGCRSDGVYTIADLSAGLDRFTVDPAGTVTVLNNLYVNQVGGLHFGNKIAPGGVPTDTSNHITLWDTGYGFSITGGTLNVVSGITTAFYPNGTLIANLNASGMQFAANTTVTLGRDPSANLEAATRQYVDNKVAAAGGVGLATSYTTPGTYSYADPGPTYTFINVDIFGGGGSGSPGSNQQGGSGGGGGAHVRTLFKRADLTFPVTITVGAGGAAVAGILGTPAVGPPPPSGLVGGNTRFGNYLTAYGGGGGGHASYFSGGGQQSGQAGGGGGGSAGAGEVGGNGGEPVGFLYGAAVGRVSTTGPGGGGSYNGGTTGGLGGSAEWGGAGGAPCDNSNQPPSGTPFPGAAGGASLYGGAGGGSGGNLGLNATGNTTSAAGGPGGQVNTYNTYTAPTTGPSGGAGGTNAGMGTPTAATMTFGGQGGPGGGSLVATSGTVVGLSGGAGGAGGGGGGGGGAGYNSSTASGTGGTSGAGGSGAAFIGAW